MSLEVDAGAKGGAKLPAGAKMLNNDAGFAGFLGAAPPEGHRPHRYLFVVSAITETNLPEVRSGRLPMLQERLIFQSAPQQSVV